MFKSIHLGFLAIFVTSGFVIMGVSLTRAAQASYSSESMSSPTPSSFQHRLGGEIMPGHVMYPLTVVADHTELLFESESEKMVSMVRLSQERLEMAEGLFALKQHSTAILTLTKGQRYLLTVIEQLPQLEDPVLRSALTSNTLKTLETYQTTFHTHKFDVSDAERVSLDELLEENRVLQEKIH